MTVPKELKYTADHEWIIVEGNQATFGITDFAQTELGDIVFVELPEEGDDVEKGESYGSVESTKTVSDLITPLTGTVIAINEELADSPELVNESPYEKAWMIKIEIADESQIADLLSAEQYEAEIS